MGGAQGKLSKFGPWGGDGERQRDIAHAKAPDRLDSITIRSGDVIDSISFSYIDSDGQSHTTLPWGGYGGANKNSVSVKRITLSFMFKYEW